MAWSAEEEQALTIEYRAGADIAALATRHQRKISAITKRLEKLGLVAEAAEPEGGHTEKPVPTIAAVNDVGGETNSAILGRIVHLVGRLSELESVIASNRPMHARRAAIAAVAKSYRVLDTSLFRLIVNGQEEQEAVPDDSEDPLPDRLRQALVEAVSAGAIIPH
jgi:hypothetical protein